VVWKYALPDHWKAAHQGLEQPRTPWFVVDKLERQYMDSMGHKRSAPH
jgi:hypothetical protein